MKHQVTHINRNCRDRIEEIRAESGQLPTTALPSNTDSEHDEDTDQDEAAENNIEAQEMRRLRQSIAQRKKLATPSPPNNVTNGAPGRHKRTTSSGSIEDGVYSTLSNEMYSKVASPGGSVNITSPMAQTSEAALTGNRPPDKRRSREELKQRLRELALTSETGSASVIEVIEPTSSEEDEFRRSIWHEMNVKWAAAAGGNGGAAAGAAEDHRGGGATVPRRRKEAAAALSKGDASAVNAAGGVELSPTKRLLEMGISPSTLDDLKTEENEEGRQLPMPKTRTMLHVPDASGVDEAQDVDKKSSGFFKKIANWNKKRGERKEPAGREENEKVNGSNPGDDVLDTAEEHVLPDSFEDVAVSPPEEGSKGTPKVDFILHSGATAKPVGTAVAVASATEGSRSSSSSGNKSLSPQSRKSLNGSKSTMMSEDSGIFVSKDMQGTASLVLPNGLDKIEESSRNIGVTGLPNEGTEAVPGRVQRAVMRMNNNNRSHKNFDVNPVTLLRKKSLESKAWYDVPSDEERAGGGCGGVGEQEVDDEADESLASIISTGRPSSDED